ncbi:hypothetical protein Msil_0470 [Methylocella silvestris BL2]|uniref:DUF2946 domain-containing protein n=2 Tax=Methylocella silvestris TaxID=199596 RepID=B8EJN9_METSB|nr:hypothetical protein Msil_0470 [Methylocella silvestris BL2]
MSDQHGSIARREILALSLIIAILEGSTVTASQRACVRPRRHSAGVLAFALAAWIAVVFAPLHLCCLGRAPSFAAQTSALDGYAPIIMCSSHSHDGDHAPDDGSGHSSHTDCACCGVSDALATAPDAMFAPARSPVLADESAPAVSFGFFSRRRTLAGRPRAPPSSV